MDTEYIDRQIAELRNVLLGQIRELSDQIASLRQELKESHLRQQRLESNARRH